MAAVATLHVSIHSSLPDLKEYQSANCGPIKEQASLRKKGPIVGKEDQEVGTANKCPVPTDSGGEDDDDVISGNVTKRKEASSKISSPYISPNLGSGRNSIVKAFLRDRKQFSPSWSEAAESVFSDSHPFKQKRRNRSEEKAETQDKEKLPSRCSSESRCSSPKNRKKEHVLPSEKAEEVVKKRDADADVDNHQSAVVHKQRKKESASKAQELKPTYTAVVAKESKLEPPKIHSDHHHRHAFRSKRASLSQAKQRQSTYINSERLVVLKAKVECAIKEHKVYSMTGHYSSVRRALKQRGWVEKFDSDFKGKRKAHQLEETDETALHITGKSEIEKDGEGAHVQAEAEIINRMLRNINEDLCWLSKPYPYCWKDMNKCDMVNRLPKAYFSNKVGLCNSLAHMQWYFEPGVCSTQYPRTYNISLRDEYDSFKDDFRLTACVSTLKWLTNSYKLSGESSVRSSEGRVDVNIIEFALRRCAEYVKYREHEDIDMAELPTTWEHQWDHFLTQYYKLVNEGHILREAKEDPPTVVIVSNAQTMINVMRPYWPQMDIEGINNFWIVKPGGRCCGNGIVIRNHLEEIMAIVNPTITRETRYVVQKYIERPLLIYNTKFDIRQWFLVTNVYPLTIWMYRESYLRFCSSQFNLKNTHESIHLCNNAVQRRYKNGKRDRNLPDENMWDCYTFQTYLKAIGYPSVWDEVIYPGMKESFVGALLASQDNMERRKNCFELYGADFMISDQLTDGPWLIEINSNPAMDSSTSVTARMCPQVLEDIVKVVIDRRTDRNASTGAFELVFKQNCPPIPPYLGMSLSIRGKKVYKSASETRNARRPRYQVPESDSEEVSSDESEENIVEKRCTGDFMQPIKTLREEIERLGSRASKDGYLSVREELYSDSAANDTDTSRGSNSDRRMTLEGKEIALKKKKIRKRRHKCVLKQDNRFKYRTDIVRNEIIAKKEEASSLQKRVINQKTDWVRRNIDNIRGNNSRYNFSKPLMLHEREEGKNITRSQENLNIYKDYILSGQCFEEYKAANQNSHEVLETLFRDEMLKMLSAAENHDLREERRAVIGRKRSTPRERSSRCLEDDAIVKPKQGPVIITGLWEPAASKTEPEERDQTFVNEENTTSAGGSCHLMVEGVNSGRRDSSVEELDRSPSCNSLNFESDKNSTSVGDITDGDVIDSIRSSPRTNARVDAVDQNADFETKFESELRYIECKKSRHKRKLGDFTKALNITAPDLLVKERGKPNKWQNTKSSMEYFKEWKYKIDETRRNCEDMLTKLRYFKESNSKLKFQDVLHRRIEEEARLIQKMKQYKLANGWKKITESDGDCFKHVKPEIDERIEDERTEGIQETKCSKTRAKYLPFKDLAPKIYAVSLNLKENRLPSYYANLEETPLAISAESGAVRNVSEVLPKIRLRNRPLLPNAGSGHCRKLDQIGGVDKSARPKVKGSLMK